MDRTHRMHVPGLAGEFQSARISTAGPAVLRPRSSGMTELAVPGSLAARSADRDRRAQERAGLVRPTVLRQPDAGDLACATSACTVFGAGGAALAAATRCSSVVVGAGTPKPRPMPGTTLGLSHHSSPRAGGPARSPFSAAAERDDSAGQFRPVLMPRPDAIAVAHPGDHVTEMAADRRGLGLRRARRKVRPPVRPHGRQPAGTAQASGERMLQQETDQHGKQMDEPLR